jgi:hypothetical protein
MARFAPMGGRRVRGRVADAQAVEMSERRSAAGNVARIRAMRRSLWRRWQAGRAAVPLTREEVLAAIAAFVAERGVRRVSFGPGGSPRIVIVRS